MKSLQRAIRLAALPLVALIWAYPWLFDRFMPAGFDGVPYAGLGALLLIGLFFVAGFCVPGPILNVLVVFGFWYSVHRLDPVTPARYLLTYAGLHALYQAAVATVGLRIYRELSPASGSPGAQPERPRLEKDRGFILALFIVVLPWAALMALMLLGSLGLR